MERFAVVCSDSEEDLTSEYGMAESDAVPIGSQYSSKGELYNWDTDADLFTSESSTSECLYAI